MGSLAYILVCKRPLASDVQDLVNQFIRLDISEPSRVLAFTVSQFSLYEHIREGQYGDPHLLVLKDTVQQGDDKKVSIGNDGVLRMQGQICVPNVDGLREVRALEAWRFASEWKWECISMDFVVGLPRTLKKFDAVWVIVDRLTKSAHFIPVAATYSSEWLAKIYIREIVLLHVLATCRVCLQQQLPIEYSNALYEALCGRRCRSPVGWFDPGEAQLLGTDLVRDALEKVKMIQDQLCTTQSRQKSYADQRVCDVVFMVGEKVLLWVSPIKGVMRF
ncbi:uncharacterized protein [Nicotiana tomentosiformis]|uniref:uncharacterized protein n=1 Tax=Nicotiana tomentosiformis TaxID=4098 RepID=UPI00388C8D9C